MDCKFGSFWITPKIVRPLWGDQGTEKEVEFSSPKLGGKIRSKPFGEGGWAIHLTEILADWVEIYIKIGDSMKLITQCNEGFFTISSMKIPQESMDVDGCWWCCCWMLMDVDWYDWSINEYPSTSINIQPPRGIASSAGSNLRILRVLRLTRLTRIFRVLRVVRFVRPLQTLATRDSPARSWGEIWRYGGRGRDRLGARKRSSFCFCFVVVVKIRCVLWVYFFCQTKIEYSDVYSLAILVQM